MYDENRLRFTRSHRLLQAADYRFVFKEPAKYSTRNFTILYRPNGLGRARLGLAISKKIVKNAVKRNQLKRFLRETFRIDRQYLGAFDIVVLVRKDASKRLASRCPPDDPGKLWRPLFRL